MSVNSIFSIPLPLSLVISSDLWPGAMIHRGERSGFIGHYRKQFSGLYENVIGQLPKDIVV